MWNRKYPSVLRKQGFIIDDNTYPWFAHKGLRYSPDQFEYSYTDLEESLILALKKVEKYKGYNSKEYILGLLKGILGKYK